MKPKLYYGNNPQQFAPCDATLKEQDVSIKLHPAVLAVRNKRKRMRIVRGYASLGIKFFVRPVWEIYPANAEVRHGAKDADLD
jgi:hypothetical protein